MAKDKRVSKIVTEFLTDKKLMNASSDSEAKRALENKKLQNASDKTQTQVPETENKNDQSNNSE